MAEDRDESGQAANGRDLRIVVVNAVRIEGEDLHTGRQTGVDSETTVFNNSASRRSNTQ